MSILNSVLGSLSPPPRFRRSFEDPHARDHELPLYHSPPSPRIPPPVTSSVLWNTPRTSLSPPSRVPEDLLALQRRARHLETQLQELLDAQADGLVRGLGGEDATPDDLVSNGSTTPTVSSTRSVEPRTQLVNGDHHLGKKKPPLHAARRGISRRIKQLADTKLDELDFLDSQLRDLQSTVEKTQAWSQKRSRLEQKITGIEGQNAGVRGQLLRTEASKLHLDIRHKEEELRLLKSRHRQVLDQLADTENSTEARLSSYKTSLSLLDREVSDFLAQPPHPDHISLGSSPFLSLPAKRRTLEMAREYWQDEYTRLAEKCEEVDVDRNALDEGAVMWKDVMERVTNYELGLQEFMRQAGQGRPNDTSRMLDQMVSTIALLEEKWELASARSWNLLVCAVGAELEAFKQGRNLLEGALGVSLKGKGKEKAVERSLDSKTEQQDMTGSAIRISRSPQKASTAKQQLFDTDEEDEDPDPELLISHQDIDTD